MKPEQAVLMQKELCEETLTAARAAEKMAAHGFRILGMGKARVAVESDDKTSILKLAWQEAGVPDNALEARVFQSASDELEPYLAPVLETFEGHVSRQARCRPIEFTEEAVSVIEVLGRHGIIDGIQNLGFLEGKLVCYDYATLGMGKFLDLLEESETADS